MHKPVLIAHRVMFKVIVDIDPLYTGRLFHCFILDESIYQFRGVGCILSLLFLMENLFNEH